MADKAHIGIVFKNGNSNEVYVDADEFNTFLHMWARRRKDPTAEATGVMNLSDASTGPIETHIAFDDVSVVQRY